MTLATATLRRLLPLVLLAACGCGRHEGGGELHARKVVLEREVQGLREAAVTLERGEPLVPLNDVAVAIDEGLVRDLIAAQLPFEADVDRFHVILSEVQALFRGTPTVRLRGHIALLARPAISGEMSVLGALEQIAVNPATGTLRAHVAVDHLEIEKAAGVESVLAGSTLDELARTIRHQLKDRLPPIAIPIRIEERIVLPAVTEGPVRVDGAAMPLAVGVSRVFAGQGRLWIGLSVQPGHLVKTTEAPPVAEASPAGVEMAGEKGGGR